MDIDLSNLNLDDLLAGTQAAQHDVEKYDRKDKIEEMKQKAEKQAAKEQNKLLQDTLKASEAKTSKSNEEDDRVVQFKKKIKEYEQ